MNFVEYTIENRKAILRLNRPEKRNALNQDFVLELLQCLDIIEKDDSAKVVVLEGKGDVFCAGADLGYLQQLQTNTYEENLEDSRVLKSLFERIYNYPKVIVAKVHGHAIAGGAGLATVCDIVFAAPEAKFGYTEVNIGFIPAIVSIFLLRKIGEAKANDLLLSGKLVSAEEALQYGMINFVVPSSTLDQDVEEYTDRLIHKTSAQSLRATKNLIKLVQDIPQATALDRAAEMNAQGRESEDCKKGIAAFLNKEKITW